MTTRAAYLPNLVAFCALVAVVLIWLVSSPDARSAMNEEGGPVEVASAVSYVVLAVLTVVLVRSTMGRVLGLILFLFALREWDMDKTAFTEGLLKARQYTGDRVGLVEKLLSFALLMLILFAVGYMLVKGTPPLLRALRRGSAWAFAIVIAAACLVVAKTIDGIERKLSPFSVRFSEETLEAFKSLEETLELGAPMFLAAALFRYARDTTADGAA